MFRTGIVKMPFMVLLVLLLVLVNLQFRLIFNRLNPDLVRLAWLEPTLRPENPQGTLKVLRHLAVAVRMRLGMRVREQTPLRRRGPNSRLRVTHLKVELIMTRPNQTP